MAQSERSVRSLPEFLEEQNQLDTTEGRLPGKICLVSVGGPNGCGKSSILKGLEWLLSTAYKRISLYPGGNYREQSEIFRNCDLRFFREPTPLFSVQNTIPTNYWLRNDEPDSYRTVVMQSDSPPSPLEAFALFAQGRRRIQEWLVRYQRGQSLCVLDRSNEATIIHQILLNKDRALAQYLDNALKGLHQAGYFLPYQQTFLVIPPTMKLRKNDTDPHTDLRELEAYKQLVRERMLDHYCDQTLWVENDPLGQKNYLALPTYAIAVAIYAQQVFGKLKTSKEYELNLPLYKACR